MIAIASDHGGLELKESVKKHLQERNIEYKDFGTYDNSSCDYPDFGAAAAKAVIAYSPSVKKVLLSALQELEFQSLQTR